MPPSRGARKRPRPNRHRYQMLQTDARCRFGAMQRHLVHPIPPAEATAEPSPTACGLIQ